MRVIELIHRLERMLVLSEDLADNIANLESLYEACGYEDDADKQNLARLYVALTAHLVSLTKESVTALNRYAVTGQDDVQLYFRAWKEKLLPMVAEIKDYTSSIEEIQK
jgi:hypothetical protein